MQQSGEYRIEAPVEAVWQALNDPDVLCRCIDGCQSMERVGEDAFRAVVKARVGPVSAPFTADIAISDQDPPLACTLTGQVKGGPAGFGKGTAKVQLAPDGDGGSRLRYTVEGSVGGKLAQVGQRLIDGAARKMADDFFAAFGAEVGASRGGEPEAAAASPPPARPRRAWLWVGLAVAALIVVVAIVLLA